MHDIPSDANKPGHAADKEDLTNVFLRAISILQSFVTRVDRALHDGIHNP